jgi:hypothetical protein
MPQRIEGRDSRAEQRAGIRGSEALRNRCERFHGSEHVFLIAAVAADSRNLQIHAIRKISAAARQAYAAVPAVSAHSDALCFFPTDHSGSHFVDDSGDFVSRNPWVLNS